MTETPSVSLGDILTLGPAAEALGIKNWQLERLFTTGRAPRPGKIGHYRVVPKSELPRLREAAVAAGYIKLEAAPDG